MRIRVDYSTVYDYSAPASDVLQLLRVQPSGHEGQHILHWRIDTDTDGHLRHSEDAYGNITHMFYPDGPVRRLSLHVTGEVDTSETGGVLSSMHEPLPAGVFLRATPLTEADAAIRAFARECRGADPLASCHAMMTTLNETMVFDADVTHAYSSAAHAYGIKAGVCQDYAHIFCAAARFLGIPARYVSGHLVRDDGLVTQPAAHAWAEAQVPGLGWVAFDPTNGVCATQSYLRVAIGLDYLEAAPIRGARRGGGMESMVVSVTTSESNLGGGQASMVGQSQSQVQG
ncbi:transglutaminase family protein [Sandarakinorhabdus sp.]|uniref:transglutaminase family protein n=1 Tax=Sandarakinorhabdus sp. TaxID=1916663 RepID=UPI00286EA01A|nr:transglutaminase family protein [Sandarakinorhabdus sp.]